MIVRKARLVVTTLLLKERMNSWLVAYDNLVSSFSSHSRLFSSFSSENSSNASVGSNPSLG